MNDFGVKGTSGVNPPVVTEQTTTVGASSPPVGDSGVADVDKVSKKDVAIGDSRSVRFGDITVALNDAAQLEFVLWQAMSVIVKSRLDSFLENMKDNVATMREGMNAAYEQADSIREQGNMMLGGAIAGGLMTIGGAGVSMAGAGASMKSAMSNGKFQLGQFQSSMQKWGGISQATNSVGTIADGGMKYAATGEQASAAEEKSESDMEMTLAQNIRESGKSDQEFIKTLLATLGQMSDSGHQARSKVVG